MSEAEIQTQQNYVEAVLFPISMPYVISPILSVIATFIVIICCIIFKSYKEPLGVMILSINSSDFVFCFIKATFSFLLPTTDFYCKLVQAIGQYGFVSSVLWGAFFGHALLIITRNFQIGVLQNFMKYYLTFGIGVPLGLAVASMLTDYVEYENINGVEKCVHRSYNGQFDVTFAVFTTIPLSISCILSIIWYAMAAKNLRVFLKGNNAKHLLTLIVYPGIMIITWVPTLFIISLTPFGLVTSGETRALTQAIDQMQGLFDALIYGGSKQALLTKLITLVCCKKRKNSNSFEMAAANQVNPQMTEDGVTNYDPEEKLERSVTIKGMALPKPQLKHRAITFKAC